MEESHKIKYGLPFVWMWLWWRRWWWEKGACVCVWAKGWERSTTKLLIRNALLPIDFSQNVYLNSNKRQIPSNVEFEVKKMKKQQQQTAAAAFVFGEQTNNTCAVSLNDRANKQTASEPNNISDAAIHISLIHQFSVRDEIYIHIESDAQANKSDFEYAIWCWRIFVYIYGIRSWMRPGKTDVEALLTISNNN